MRYLLGLGFLPFGNMIEHAIDILFVSWDAFGTVWRFLCCSYMYTIVSLIAFVVDGTSRVVSAGCIAAHAGCLVLICGLQQKKKKNK